MNELFTYEQVSAGMHKLKKELGHEPTSHEVDDCEYLPTTRQIQRRYGGLKKLRKEIGFNVTDHTSGLARTKTAHRINDRARKYETQMEHSLIKKYHKVSGRMVVRQYAYTQWIDNESCYANKLSDIALIDTKLDHIHLIDFFYPDSDRNFKGCIRAKIKNIEKTPISLIPPTTHELIFVCMNKHIDQAMIDSYNKQNTITIMSIQDFNKRFLL